MRLSCWFYAKQIGIPLPMHYEKIKSLKPSDFKRRFGIQPATFDLMAKEVKKEADKRKKKKNKKNAGRKRKLSSEDEILMTLTYWRDYRTQFHLGVDYEISETVVCRTIKRVENILSKCKQFELPGIQKRKGTKLSYEVIVIDATESPIERPKKNKRPIIQAKRESIR
jgi:Helix-turn-helix of DDE superfamily endonuclease